MEAFFIQLYSSSLELVILVIAVIINVFLAVAVLRSEPKSATNRIFALLTLFTVAWLATIYLLQQTWFANDSLLILHRLGIAFAAPMSSLFFLLAHTLPAKTIRLHPPTFYLVIGVTVMTIALNLSSYTFIGVTTTGTVSQPQAGWGIVPFSLISTVFSVLAVYLLVRKYRRATGVEKNQFRSVLSGITIMLALVTATILLPILFLGGTPFLALAPLYTLIFLGATAYAIVQYQLFDIKVLLTQALTLTISVVLFAKVFVGESLSAQVVDGLVLLFTIVFGVFLVRSVRREVEQREQIQELADELKQANTRLRELDRQKSEFLSIAAHQLRTPLTAIKGYTSLMLEGSYGELSKEAKKVIETIFASSGRMVDTVADFLNVSRIEQGAMEYRKVNADICEIAERVVTELSLSAKEKGLELTYEDELSGACPVFVDVSKIEHVISNLVDNAIKYTPEGSVSVRVEEHDGNARVSVSDTGTGIAPGDIGALFDKFVRTRNARDINVTGTGLGLYVAREMVRNHDGEIWAESDGEGKGSTFVVELPLKASTSQSTQ